MFHSIHHLKCEPADIDKNPAFPDVSNEYHHILDICKSGLKIPALSLAKVADILTSMKKHVNDFYSITSLHYLNAGDEGIFHFFHLMNAVISNVNISGIAELNTIYAIVLYKGHGKNTEDTRSYCTISTCPILAKALDIYLRGLSCGEWTSQQATTQFQGQKMSHELASLLLTETIVNSDNVSKRPVFALFLDARAAFNRVVRKILVRNLFAAGIHDQRLVYFDKRLGSRYTYCEYDKELMGPILDLRGLEQGGVSSSELYKLYNNEQANVAQASRLGVPLVCSKESVKPVHLQLTSSPTISCISLADDAVLLANTPVDLSNLLMLTNQYC